MKRDMYVYSRVVNEEVVESALLCNDWLHVTAKSTHEHARCILWQYRLWSFQGRDTKLERILAKNQL